MTAKRRTVLKRREQPWRLMFKIQVKINIRKQGNIFNVSTLSDISRIPMTCRSNPVAFSRAVPDKSSPHWIRWDHFSLPAGTWRFQSGHPLSRTGSRFGLANLTCLTPGFRHLRQKLVLSIKHAARIPPSSWRPTDSRLGGSGLGEELDGPPATRADSVQSAGPANQGHRWLLVEWGSRAGLAAGGG